MSSKVNKDKSQLYFLMSIGIILVVSIVVYLSLLYRIQDTEKRLFESIHELRVENAELKSKITPVE